VGCQEAKLHDLNVAVMYYRITSVLSTNASGDFSKGVDLIVAQELEVLENPRGLCGYAAKLGYYQQSPFENDRGRT
jgi:hypothetical protein